MLLKNGLRYTLLIALAIAMAAPASATLLIRQDLDDLVKSNHTVVVGEVVDVYSYWNDEGTFILTEALIYPREVLKGKVGDEVVVTLMGGTVGDLTTLIVGGAQLTPGNSYVLFVDSASLPGAPGVSTISAHGQGVFEVMDSSKGSRAVSQANDHPLLPDSAGNTKAAGGLEGFPLEAMLDAIALAAATQSEETK